MRGRTKPARRCEAIDGKVGKEAPDGTKATRTRAQELHALAEWKAANPNGAVRPPRQTVDEILREAHDKWTAENPTVAGSSPAPTVQKSMRVAKAQPTQATHPRRRDLGKTPAEMRANVLRNCEDEIRLTLVKEKAPVDPETFLRGLRGVRAEEKADLERLRRIRRGHELLSAIRDARDEAQRLFESERDLPWPHRTCLLPYQAPLNGLASIVDILRGRSELDICPPQEDVPTHRQVVLGGFGHDRFLGKKGRQADNRELALLSLYLDPDSGIDQRLDPKQKQTWWNILKSEVDAIRLARKRLRK